MGNASFVNEASALLDSRTLPRVLPTGAGTLVEARLTVQPIQELNVHTKATMAKAIDECPVAPLASKSPSSPDDRGLDYVDDFA